MDRRTFNKLMTGAAATLGIPAAEVSGLSEAPHAAALSNKADNVHEAVGDWELVILDAAPEHMTETAGNAAADIDGGGKTELVMCGNGALL